MTGPLLNNATGEDTDGARVRMNVHTTLCVLYLAAISSILRFTHTYHSIYFQVWR